MPETSHKTWWIAPLLLVVLVALSAWVAGRINHRRYNPEQPLVRPVPEDLTGQEFVGTVMLGGLRGVVVDYLWVTAADQMEKGQFEQLAVTTEAISRMSPYQSTAWIFHSWNLAWNVSEAFTSREESFRWIRRGLEHARRGAGRNPRDPMLAYHVGWLIERRILKDDYFIARLLDDTVHLQGGVTLVGRLHDTGTGGLILEASVRPVVLARTSVSRIDAAGDGRTLVVLTDGTRLVAVVRRGADASTGPVLELEQVEVDREAVERIEHGENAWMEAITWYDRASSLLDETDAAIDTAEWIYHGQSRFVRARYVEQLLREDRLDEAAEQLDAYRRRLDDLLERYPLASAGRVHRVFLRNRMQDYPKLRIELGLARVDQAISSAEPSRLRRALDELTVVEDLLMELWPALTDQFIRRPSRPTYHRMLELKNTTLPTQRSAIKKLLSENTPTPLLPPIPQGENMEH